MTEIIFCCPPPARFDRLHTMKHIIMYDFYYPERRCHAGRTFSSFLRPTLADIEGTASSRSQLWRVAVAVCMYVRQQTCHARIRRHPAVLSPEIGTIVVEGDGAFIFGAV